MTKEEALLRALAWKIVYPNSEPQVYEKQYEPYAYFVQDDGEQIPEDALDAALTLVERLF